MGNWIVKVKIFKSILYLTCVLISLEDWSLVVLLAHRVDRLLTDNSLKCRGSRGFLEFPQVGRFTVNLGHSDYKIGILLSWGSVTENSKNERPWIQINTRNSFVPFVVGIIKRIFASMILSTYDIWKISGKTGIGLCFFFNKTFNDFLPLVSLYEPPPTIPSLSFVSTHRRNLWIYNKQPTKHTTGICRHRC